MPKLKNTMKGVSSTIKNGSEYWYARIDGQKKYCGKGDKGRDIAIAAKAKEVAKAYENKEVNVNLKVKKVEFKSIKALFNWYMQLPKIQAQAGYSRKVYASVHLIEFFGRKPLSKADADNQERYRVYRIKQGAAEATVNLEIELLSAVYHLALKRKKIPADVMPGEFVFEKDATSPRRMITKVEYDSLLSENTNPDFKDMMICAYETAMRSREICTLTPSQVKLNIRHISGQTLNYIDLGIFDTKTKARRTVPVSARLKAILKRKMEGLDSEDYIFTQDGVTYTRHKIRDIFKAACDKAEIIYGDKPVNKKGEKIGIVFHCFRHIRTTEWVKMGFSDEIIRRATGHKSLEAYRNYVKLDASAVMRLVEDSETDKNGIKSLQMVTN